MRNVLLVAGGVLLVTAITCTGPDRDFVDAPDTSSNASSSAGGASHSSSSASGSGSAGGAGGSANGSGSGTGPSTSTGTGMGGGTSTSTSSQASSGATGGAGTSTASSSQTSSSQTSSSQTSSSQTSSSQASSGATGGAGGSICEDATHTCLEKAPAGWTGPVALYQGPGGSSPPPCGSPYPTTAADYKGSIDEGMPVCDCTCNATNIVCTASAGLGYVGNGIGACQQLGQTTPLPPGQCVPIPTSASPKMDLLSPAPVQMGSCVPQPTKSIAPPTWGTAARACDGASTTDVGCAAGDLCAPVGVAPYDSMCVVSPGDVACPDAFYAKKNTFYTGFTDTRDCSACVCGSAVSTCGGTVTLTHSLGNPNNGCVTPEALDGVRNVPTCSAYAMAATGALYSPAPSGSCPHTGAALTGMVVTNGASTVCCH